jgi:hypothetical protein
VTHLRKTKGVSITLDIDNDRAYDVASQHTRSRIPCLTNPH